MTKEMQSMLERKKLKEKENTKMPKGKVPVMIGDKMPLLLVILKTHPMEEHMDTIPWIPYHPTLWIS